MAKSKYRINLPPSSTLPCIYAYPPKNRPCTACSSRSGGTWRCQVMMDGKRVSVVAETPGEAQAKAVALKNGLIEESALLKEGRKGALTLSCAIDRYIESREGYRREQS